MSGGGSDGGVGPPQGSGGRIPCHLLVVQTLLSSPKAQVVDRLKEGDELDVEVRDGILVATDDGRIAGSLVSPQSLRIMECIGQGIDYVAEVLDVSGGAVEVKVHSVETE